MNKQLSEYARETIKAGLAKLPESNQLIFKRMYSPDDLGAEINSVVDSMPNDRLDHAVTQVQRTLDKGSAK